jgi:hypothetical protein
MTTFTYRSSSYGRADYTVLCIFALREKSVISSNEPTFFCLHPYSCLFPSLGLASKFRSEKIPIGFRYSTEKILIPRNSVRLGIPHFKVLNGKNSAKK